MRVILKISLLIIICTLVYRCTKTEYVPELQNEDEDEIGWIGEDLTGEDLTERASTFKISQVVAADSLPIFQVANPTKKQKFGKRQIVSTTAKTRFWIRGIGFGVRGDSSSVQCFIKKVRQENPEIVSWDSTQVVVDLPVLTSDTLINNTFSIQFKLFKKNLKNGKPNISRSRSRSCISDKKAKTVVGEVCATSGLQLALNKRAELGYGSTFEFNSYRAIQSWGVISEGDILKDGTSYGVVVSITNKTIFNVRECDKCYTLSNGLKCDFAIIQSTYSECHAANGLDPAICSQGAIYTQYRR